MLRRLVTPAFRTELSRSYKTKALIARRAPFPIDVEAGKTYFYCTCGASKRQPFCDGSHKVFNKENDTNFAPSKYVADVSDTVYFCGCKQSDGPLCDGSHASLPVDQ